MASLYHDNISRHLFGLRRLADHLCRVPAAAADAPEAAAGEDERYWNADGPPESRILEPAEITTKDDLYSARSARLSPEEATFFRQNGYIIKRQLILPADLQPFVEQLWQEAPPEVVREDMSTWVDPGKRWLVGTGGHGSNLHAFSDTSNWWWGGIGHDEAFLAATSRHPKVLSIVESLLGGPIHRPNRNRGLYTIWPSSEAKLTLGPHVDSQGEELLATTLLGDVGHHDGPFTFWPGSHALMWNASDQETNWLQNENFLPLMQQCKASIRPRTFTGACGDTLFWSAFSTPVRS